MNKLDSQGYVKKMYLCIIYYPITLIGLINVSLFTCMNQQLMRMLNVASDIQLQLQPLPSVVKSNQSYT